MLDFSDHADHVEATVASRSAAARCRIAASWRRSKTLHHLDPATDRPARQLTGAGLDRVIDQAGPLRRQAEPELDRLFKILGRGGVALFLANADGVIVSARSNLPRHNVFAKIGLGLGTDCSEQHEGTNGIGTCILAEAPLVIDRDQHFFARNGALTTLATPVFGSDGALAGVIAYCTSEPVMLPGAHPLILETLRQSARHVESGLFRAAYPAERILIAPQGGADDLALLAVDHNDFVVGATRAVRQRHRLTAVFTPRPAADLLGQNEPARDMHDIRRKAILHALHNAQGNVSAAARQLGLGRATLYNQMKRLNIRD